MANLALRKTEPAFGVDLVEIFASGSLAPDEVEIEVLAAGICGSDLHAYAWDKGYEFMRPLLPVTIGHEFCGTVRTLGSAVAGTGSVAVGDRVVCWPTVPCGDCNACREGEPLACEVRRIIGLHRDGGFCSRVRVPAANCLSVPPGMPPDVAALAEPLAIAIHAAELAGLKAGSRVVVLGPGPIGLAVAWIAAQEGARVLLVGLDDPHRLKLARDMGIENVADLSDGSLVDHVQAAFGRNVDRVIEATGAPASVEDGLLVLRPRGILVAAGIHSGQCSIDLADLVRGKKQIRGAHDTTERAFRRAIDLLDRKGGALGQLISHRLPLRDALRGFELARGKAAMKIILYPNGSPGET
ncbi:alcohol dehydrogenase catalytic domain-containing protein [uncultured Jannaschia sp.]|uniref:zinc-dependent alcohol dehydrogenase n=1 Tax=uncultured Jannaschia sp. TaxID=293347 RepID=UPI00261CA42B|nr:alcohol dehydrogenase catalytic domain-containing protein [uncultured Jannaschia sp.]